MLFSYKQSIYDIILKYMENNFEYYISSDSGKREEHENLINISTCENMLKNKDIKLDMSNEYLTNLKKFLKDIKHKLNSKNIGFSTYMKLHNEKVLINENKEDNRYYGLFRLIFKDSYNNVYLDEFSVSQSNPEGLKDKILSSVQKNENIVSFKKSSITHKKFDSMPVILSPRAAGYFIHEIVGHILEEDFYSYYEEKYKDLKVSDKLIVYDSIENSEYFVGLNKYDDLGVKIKPLTLISNGKINNIFAISEKNSFDNKLYGISRRESYKFDTMPRMRCTCVSSCDNINSSEFSNKYNTAVFLDKAYIGGVNPQTGDYSVNGNGFLIKDGIRQNFIGNLKLSGNIIRDLLKFDYIGNDFEINGNYCSKLGQCVRVATGSPTISLRDIGIEGDVYDKM